MFMEQIKIIEKTPFGNFFINISSSNVGNIRQNR